MYFRSRTEAGQKLAAQLPSKYREENSTVLALSNGGVVVGAEIAVQLHCGLAMLVTAAITLPQEHDPLAAIDQEGSFTYNSMFSTGQLEEFVSEYHNYIEQEKIQKLHEMNHILGPEGMISKDILRRHNVILVSDGFVNGFSLDVAAHFLKPIRTKRLIVTTPLASIEAVDRMHMLADEMYCLSVPDNYISTDHYYEEQDVPDQKAALEIIRNISLYWE
jgi:putative phosphoribosyl transferase